MVSTFAFRTIAMGLIGTYGLIFPNTFALLVLYYILTTITEVPNIFYTYWNHLRMFQPKSDEQVENSYVPIHVILAESEISYVDNFR